MTTLSELERAKRHQSAALVKSGLQPLPRMDLPTVEVSCPVVYVCRSGDELVVCDERSSKKLNSITSLDTESLVVWEDEQTLHMFFAKFGHTAPGFAKAVKYLVKQPYHTRHACLTTMLSRKWWDPFSGKGTVEQWGRALGFEGTSKHDLMILLLDMCSSTEFITLGVHRQLKELQKRVTGLSVDMVQKPRDFNFKIYDTAQLVHELWMFLERLDPKLRELKIVNGETVAVLGYREYGKQFIVKISQNCKIRSGDILLMNEHDVIHQTSFTHFLADDGILGPGLYMELTLRVPIEATKYITSGFQGHVKDKKRARWLVYQNATDRPLPVERPDVPLDVVLAASDD